MMAEGDAIPAPNAAASGESLSIWAEWVLPVSGPPLHWGCVRIVAGRIESIRSAERAAPTNGHSHLVLERTILLPGLVNAHCHLELNGWYRPPSTAEAFWDWVPQVVAFRRSADYRPGQALPAGLAESLQYGTVWIGDIVPPTLLTADGLSFMAREEGCATNRGTEGMGPPAAAPRPGITAFLEFVAPRGKEPREIASLIESHLKWCMDRGVRPGLSPHAPYTVPLPVLNAIADWSVRYDLPLAIHLAETAEELAFLRAGEGPLRAMLERLGAFDAGQFPGGIDWSDYLNRLQDVPRLLVIHGNHLDPATIRRLASMGNATVVYCPRTHRRFNASAYPLATYRELGVPVAVGTDSRATSPDLALWHELRTVREGFPAIPPKELVEMVTITPARALDVDGEIGTLEPGKRADLVVVAVPESNDDPCADPYAALFHAQARVAGVWIAGRRVTGCGG